LSDCCRKALPCHITPGYPLRRARERSSQIQEGASSHGYFPSSMSSALLSWRSSVPCPSLLNTCIRNRGNRASNTARHANRPPKQQNPWKPKNAGTREACGARVVRARFRSSLPSLCVLRCSFLQRDCRLSYPILSRPTALGWSPLGALVSLVEEVVPLLSFRVRHDPPLGQNVVVRGKHLRTHTHTHTPEKKEREKER